MNVEPWFWVWVALAAVLYLAELLTPGHWMLPFALGSTLAAVLEVSGAGIAWQWAAFLGVTVVALVWLQRMARPEQPGAAGPDAPDQAVTNTQPSRTATG